ncbi:MAG: hypothetical protein IKQ95_08985 [Synergistaceae bacterium]|nr:hypothetical protein [Synergistaceae bacterium]
MRGKLRVLFLSLAVIFLTASSAFAVFTSDDVDAFIVSSSDITPPTVEGYNYYQVVYAETWPEGETPRPILWEIYPSYDWLKCEIRGNEVVFSGVLPDYDSRMTRVKSGDAPYRDSDGLNNYTIHVIARLSCDVPAGYDSAGMPLSDEDGNILTVPGEIAADADVYENQQTHVKTSGLIISVEEDTSQLGLFTDMVSIDVSAVESRDAPNENYSVSITFPQSWATEFVEAVNPNTGDFLWEAERSKDLYVLAELECRAAPSGSGKNYVISDDDNISLPYWLDYDVQEVQYNKTFKYADTAENPSLEYTESTDTIPLAKTLRIFFKQGANPQDGEKGTVRIFLSPSPIPPEDDAQSLDDIYQNGATLAWDVTFHPVPKIVIDPSEIMLNVEIQSSADAVFSYSEFDIDSGAGNITFSPAVEGVTFTAVPSASQDESAVPSGKITVTAYADSAAQEGYYAVTMSVRDENGNTSAAIITVNVVIPAISLDKYSDSVSLIRGGESSEVSFTYAKAAVSGDPIFPPGISGLTLTPTVTPADERSGKITVSITASVEAEEGTLDIPMTVIDVNGKIAEVRITVNVSTQPGEISITPAASGDTAQDITFIQGQAGTFTLNIGNTAGDVTWEITGDNVSMISPVSGTGNTATFTIDTSHGEIGSYTALLQARDGSGRQGTVYAISWTVEPVPVIELFAPNGNRISVDVESSADLTVSYSGQNIIDGGIEFLPDISADVILSADVIPASGDTPGGTIIIHATPAKIQAGVYSADMIVTDVNGNVDSMTIYVNVEIPSVILSDYAVSLSAPFGGTARKVISYRDAEIRQMTPSTVPDEEFNFSAEKDSDSGTITFSMSPAVSADYSGVMRVTDVYGNSTDIALTLHSWMSGDVGITPSDSGELVIKAGSEGGSSSVTLNAGNAYGTVTWSVDPVPEGVSIVPMTATGSEATFTVSVPAYFEGDYSVRITATDGYGRKTVYNLTWKSQMADIFFSGDFSPDPVNVVYGSSAETDIIVGNMGDPLSEDAYVPYSGWTISPDSVLQAFSIDVSGKIEEDVHEIHGIHLKVSFTPKKPVKETYNAVFTMYNYAENWTSSASTDITINTAPPVIFLSPDRVVNMSKPPFEYDWPDSHTEWYYAAPVSIDLSPIPEGFVVRCVSIDETEETDPAKHGRFIFTYRPERATGWRGTVRVFDEYGGSADIKMSLDVELTSEPMTTAVTVSGDSADSPTLYAGENTTVTLSANNSYGKVTWTISNLAALQAQGITAEKISETDTTAVYTFGLPIELAGGVYTVNIDAVDSVDRTAETYSFNINVNSAPITLSGDFAVIDVVYPASGESTMQYYYSEFAEWMMSPDISADISFDIASIPAESSTVEGKIRVIATPLKAATASYTTRLIFIDGNGNSDSRELSVNVTLPALALSSDAVTLPALLNGSGSETVSYTGAKISGFTASPDIPAVFGFSLTSDDSSLTFTAEPTAPGTYTGTITLSDIYGTSADIALTITAGIPAFTVTPSSRSATVTPGGDSSTVTFSAGNNTGAVTWTLGTLPAGVTVSPASQTGTTASYTVTASTAAQAGTYTVTVTATDSANRTATAEIRITVTADSSAFTVTPASRSATVTRGGTSAEVSFTASGNTGAVTWTLGTLPSGVTVAPATTAYATQDNTVMVYAVTASSSATAGTYTVIVTATDSAGNTATAAINITVNSSSQPQPPEAGEQTAETKALVESYKSSGALNQDGTIPDNAVTYTSTNPEAQTLSRTGTSQVSKGSAVNPVDLVLDFPVDIWKVYINDVLAAWAYSPGVSASGADDFVTFYTAEGSRGVDIVAESSTKATITFNTNAMPSGNSEIAAAFIPDATKPDQEIGKSTLATVNVSDSQSSADAVVGVGPSSGGCSAGLGVFVSALVAMFFISRKH